MIVLSEGVIVVNSGVTSGVVNSGVTSGVTSGFVHFDVSISPWILHGSEKSRSIVGITGFYGIYRELPDLWYRGFIGNYRILVNFRDFSEFPCFPCFLGFHPFDSSMVSHPRTTVLTTGTPLMTAKIRV